MPLVVVAGGRSTASFSIAILTFIVPLLSPSASQVYITYNVGIRPSTQRLFRYRNVGHASVQLTRQEPESHSHQYVYLATRQINSA
ncbi:uncharacterized protein BDZ99DRAFT_244414 [Mytilinidion resinicola]|uniref:Uncharacterized protein n=1 Tax=Mytilinidion resinicola TaxID=574789 RepID=A0A6A6YVR9_9PEZI|nr:uncharacterized protein BDZ99DRAFT_244414 [Mytilinidion resinicola]KAF2812901.1 hypothetical protein BDZ99DRAFT_244414 [Mytilinidion resinicola]